MSTAQEKDTRKEILLLAETFIRTQGYNAFSYKDISSKLDIKNAAVHYYFPSKADLGVQVVEQAIEKFDRSIQEWQALSEDEQLKRLISVFEKNNERGFICLMGSLAPDYQTLPEPMQLSVKRMSDQLVNWLTHCLEEGRKKNLIQYDGSAGDRAFMIMSNLISSLLLARVMGPEIFKKIQTQLLIDYFKVDC